MNKQDKAPLTLWVNSIPLCSFKKVIRLRTGKKISYFYTNGLINYRLRKRKGGRKKEAGEEGRNKQTNERRQTN